jgi:hypothetical protein
VEFARSKALTVPNVGQVQILGARDEAVYLDFSTRKVAALGLDAQAVANSLRAQNAIAPSGTIEAGPERISVRVDGQFTSEASLRAINLRVNDRFFPLTDVATVRRGLVDPPDSLFRFNGKPGIALAISMKAGSNLLDFGKALDAKMREIVGDLPVGVDVEKVSDQPAVVEKAVSGFTEALFEAIAIVLAISFVSLGMRAGLVVAIAIRWCWPSHPGHVDLGIRCNVFRSARSLLRWPLGRRRDDRGRDDGGAARSRRYAAAGGDARLRLNRLSDADRHAGDGGGLHPHRPQFERGRRVHFYAVRCHRGVAVDLVDRRCAVHAATWCDVAAGLNEEACGGQRLVRTGLRTRAARRDALEMDHDRADANRLRRRGLRYEIRRAAVLPQLRPARAHR